MLDIEYWHMACRTEKNYVFCREKLGCIYLVYINRVEVNKCFHVYRLLKMVFLFAKQKNDSQEQKFDKAQKPAQKAKSIDK
ncbi:hypothetical protein Hdeb2414_s0020g00560851 [Helianthus debilis subsp. tardiflorus]